MSTNHVVIAGIVVSSLTTAAQAASVSIIADDRYIEAVAEAGHPAEPTRGQEQSSASPSRPFDGALNLTVTSPDHSTVINATAEQSSSLRFDSQGGFVVAGSLFATTSTGFEPVADGPVTPRGFGSPASVFDLMLDVTGHYRWELELTMDTRGEASTTFSAFDFTSTIFPMRSDTETYKLAGDIETGRFRILAHVAAPTDPSFEGTSGKLDFVLRGTVGAPAPTAVAAVGAMMAASLLPRRR